MRTISTKSSENGFALIGSRIFGRMPIIARSGMTTLNKGFTLIELLVVVAIIALVSSVVFASLATAKAKARDANRIATARSLRTALALYEDKNGSLLSLGSGNMMSTSSGSTTVDALIGEGYLSRKIAGDAIFGTSTYYLGLCADGRYDIYTKVERPENAQTQSTLNSACGNIGATSNGFNYAYGFPAAGGTGGGLAAGGGGGGGGGGQGTTTPPVVPMPALAAGVIMASGATHTCITDGASQAFCWGDNQYGELGRADTVSPRPSAGGVGGGVVFNSITAGQWFTCGLTSAGQAYCWGINNYGQLGDGTTVNKSIPTAVNTALSFVSLSAGWDHVCGLTSSGAAYCWGRNNNGQLGDGTTSDKATPVTTNGGVLFARLVAGNHFSCGLTSAGAAYCWGDNTYGQLGDATNSQRNAPTAVSTAFVFTDISAGQSHTCAIKSGGSGYCWGSNSYHNINSSVTASFNVPTAISTGTKLSSILAGADHSCALNLDSTPLCWGRDDYAQNGVGTNGPDVTVPTEVWGSPVYTSLSIGLGGHSCGSDGPNAYCWGSNHFGEIGDGTVSGSPTHNVPTLVSMPY